MQMWIITADRNKINPPSLKVSSGNSELNLDEIS